MAIGGNRWQSVAIGGNPSQSVALRCTQSHSCVLSRTQVHSRASRCMQVHLGVEPELFAYDDGRLIQFSSLEVRQSHLRRPREYKTTRGTQWHSEALALSGTQWHSVALSGTQRYASEWGRASGPNWQHPRYSGVIRGHPRSSEAIRVTHGASRGNSTCGERGKGNGRRGEHLHVTHGASRGNSTCRSRSRSGCVRWSISSPALRSSLWLSRTSIA